MTSSDQNIFEERYLIRYLVGDLPAEEAERLDQLSIANDDFAWRLREIENDLVDAYVRSQLSGETLKIRGSRAEESGVIVSTEMINRGGEAPIKIDWRLVTDSGVFKINDVVIEGISMMVTQRSEFASVIQRHGGQVSGLLSMMREKTKTASVAQ